VRAGLSLSKAGQQRHNSLSIVGLRAAAYPTNHPGIPHSASLVFNLLLAASFPPHLLCMNAYHRHHRAAVVPPHHACSPCSATVEVPPLGHGDDEGEGENDDEGKVVGLAWLIRL
jgi:hypothetical protein